jgi:hypothetical protein
MKICSKCNQDLDASLFNIKCTKNGKAYLQPYCRDCQKVYWAVYYSNKENKEKHLKRKYKKDKQKKAELVDIVNKAKDAPCMDCKIKYNPWVMDFDHLDPDTKIDSISRLVSDKVHENKILDEIKKCELVCANCHRERTYERIHS